jgi:hypothetical protein
MIARLPDYRLNPEDSQLGVQNRDSSEERNNPIVTTTMRAMAIQRA